MLPNWTDSNRSCTAARQEWNRFLSALQVHENGHDTTAETALAAANAQASFSAMVTHCNADSALARARRAVDQQIDAELTRVTTAVDDAGDTYDDNTQHGRTQGATLDTSINCPDCDPVPVHRVSWGLLKSVYR